MFSSSHRTPPFITLLLLATALILWLVQIGDYMNGTVDDVFISLRVANNVVSGEGFVYNPGENIEGHSNWSWVGLLAVSSSMLNIASDSMQMLWLAKGWALFFSLMALCAVFKLTQRLTSSVVASAAAVLFLAASTPFGFWSICGLETPLMLFLVTSSVLQADSLRTSRSIYGAVILGLTLAALAVTRPEGIGYGVVLIGVYWLADRKIDRSLIAVLVAFAIPVAVFLIWRYSTYGMFVPNTFYAKIGGGFRRLIFGVKYALESMAGGFALVLLFLPFVIRRVDLNAGRDLIRLTSALVLFGYFFIVYSSGDWMPAYRFVVPILGAVIALGVTGLYIAWGQLGKDTAPGLRYVLVACCVVAAAAITFEGRTRTKGQTYFPITHALSDPSGHVLSEHARVAAWLDDHKDSIDLFAAGEAGLIGFLNPQMHLLDLNGLMDTTVARTKSRMIIDPAYVLQRDPDCLILMAKERKDLLIGRPSTYSEILLADKRITGRYEQRIAFDNLVIYTRRS